MSVKQATDFLLDMVEDLEKEKFSGSYVSNLVKALRNWMELNDVKITKRIQVQHPSLLVKVGDEQPPRPEEFRAVSTPPTCGPRQRAASSASPARDWRSSAITWEGTD